MSNKQDHGTKARELAARIGCSIVNFPNGKLRIESHSWAIGYRRDVFLVVADMAAAVRALEGLKF